MRSWETGEKKKKKEKEGGGGHSFVADILISNFTVTGGIKRSLYCHLPTAEFEI